MDYLVVAVIALLIGFGIGRATNAKVRNAIKMLDHLCKVEYVTTHVIVNCNTCLNAIKRHMRLSGK